MSKKKNQDRYNSFYGEMSGTELPSGMEQTLEELDELVDGLASYQPNADAEADGVVPAVKSVSRAAMSPKPTLPRDKAVSVNKENRAMSSKMERERPDFTEEDEEPTLAERVWASLGQCWAKLRVAGASVFTLPKKGLPFLKTVGTSIVALVRATGQILFSCLNLFLAKREKDEPETVRESASSSVTAQNTQTPQIDSADIDYDLEDEGRFRWVALGIKATALAAMVLILVGGYVAAKTFLAPRKPDSRAEVTEVARLADEKAAAEKLAAEKLAAEKLAAEKLAAEKLAAEKLAAEKLAAEKLAAEKLAAEKLAAEKLAAEKLAAEKLAAEKLAAEDVADPFGVALDSIAETTPVSDKATELAIDDGFPMQATQEQIVPVTPAEPQAPVLPLEAPASPIAAASQTNHAGIPSKDSLTQITESGFPVVTPLGPEPAALPLLTQSEVTPSIPVSNDIEKLTGPPGTDAIDQQSEVAPRIEVPVMAMDTTMPTPVAPPEVVLSEAGLSAVTVPTETPAVATLSNRQAMELPDFARTTQEISHRAATEVVTNPSPQTAQLSEQTFAQNLQQEVASLRQTPPPSTPHRLRLQSSQPTNDEPIPALPKTAQLFDPTVESDFQPLSVPLNPNDPSSNQLFGFLPNEDADVPSVLSGTLGEIVPEEAVLDANAPLPSFATGMGRYQTGASRRSKPSEIRAEIRGSAEPSNSLAERGARPFRQIFSDGGDDNQNSRAEMEQYTVREGDTYLTICEQKYGTTLLYTALALHNRRNGATWKPMPGTVIEIPSADYLSKTYEDYLARSRNSGRPRPAERSATATTTRPPVVRMSQGRYITQQGDTVFKIAMNRLRDSSRWQEILKLNTEIVQNAYEPLPVGMEILLPVR